jgi:hypothetical protein
MLCVNEIREIAKKAVNENLSSLIEKLIFEHSFSMNEVKDLCSEIVKEICEENFANLCNLYSLGPRAFGPDAAENESSEEDWHGAFESGGAPQRHFEDWNCK